MDFLRGERLGHRQFFQRGLIPVCLVLRTGDRDVSSAIGTMTNPSCITYRPLAMFTSPFMFGLPLPLLPAEVRPCVPTTRVNTTLGYGAQEADS